jgi:hypothetical protein
MTVTSLLTHEMPPRRPRVFMRAQQRTEISQMTGAPAYSPSSLDGAPLASAFLSQCCQLSGTTIASPHDHHPQSILSKEELNSLKSQRATKIRGFGAPQPPVPPQCRQLSPRTCLRLQAQLPKERLEAYTSQTPPLPHWLSVESSCRRLGAQYNRVSRGGNARCCRWIAPRSRQRLVEASSGQELNNFGASGESLAEALRGSIRCEANTTRSEGRA